MFCVWFFVFTIRFAFGLLGLRRCVSGATDAVGREEAGRTSPKAKKETCPIQGGGGLGYVGLLLANRLSADGGWAVTDGGGARPLRDVQ